METNVSADADPLLAALSSHSHWMVDDFIITTRIRFSNQLLFSNQKQLFPSGRFLKHSNVVSAKLFR